MTMYSPPAPAGMPSGGLVPPPRKSRGKAALILLVGLVALVAAVVVGVAASTSPPPAVVALPSSTPTAPTVAPPTTSQLAAMRAWGAQIMPLLGAVQADMRKIGTTAGLMDLAGMRGACSSLAEDVAALRRELPGPDPEVSAATSDALDDFERAATYCLSGLSTMNSTDLKLAGTYASSGGEDLERATALLDKYTT